MKKVMFAIALVLIFNTGCDQLAQIASQYPVNTAPTQTEVIAGLKEALNVGIKNAVLQTAKTDGFMKNSLIKIPVPQEAEKVMKTLRDLGFNNLVNDFETSLNRAAEQASKEAVNIFATAITQMTFQDAMGIWKGENDAATQYLKRTTSTQLEQAFSPITKKAIESVQVTKYWGDITKIYNNIPFVTPVNPDLDKYVNQMAMNGLFKMVALEEGKIRQDPAARTTEILRRVFGYTGS